MNVVVDGAGDFLFAAGYWILDFGGRSLDSRMYGKVETTYL